jgi:hypothetical protein
MVPYSPAISGYKTERFTLKSLLLISSRRLLMEARLTKRSSLATRSPPTMAAAVVFLASFGTGRRALVLLPTTVSSARLPCSPVFL